mmetsp:Transcript_9219/g.34068  ORF Transcript_9219/g.34068 Transcript_9219/m.34068 type:complete len:176 (-) Transcript_9219:1223-1750(-)
MYLVRHHQPAGRTDTYCRHYPFHVLCSLCALPTTTDTHYQNTHGFLLVYDITSESSLNEVTKFSKKIYQIKETDSFPIILCGNKCDLDSKRKVSTENGQKFADDNGFAFIETSAKSDINVKEAFEKVVQMVLSWEDSDDEEEEEVNKKTKSTGTKKKGTKKKKGIFKKIFGKKKV